MEILKDDEKFCGEDSRSRGQMAKQISVYTGYKNAG